MGMGRGIKALLSYDCRLCNKVIYGQSHCDAKKGKTRRVKPPHRS